MMCGNCSTWEIWCVGYVLCCRMWHVMLRYIWEYDVWGIWCVGNMMCGACDVWGMWCVRHVMCGACGVLENVIHGECDTWASDTEYDAWWPFCSCGGLWCIGMWYLMTSLYLLMPPSPRFVTQSNFSELKTSQFHSISRVPNTSQKIPKILLFIEICCVTPNKPFVK